MYASRRRTRVRVVMYPATTAVRQRKSVSRYRTREFVFRKTASRSTGGGTKRFNVGFDRCSRSILSAMAASCSVFLNIFSLRFSFSPHFTRHRPGSPPRASAVCLHVVVVCTLTPPLNQRQSLHTRHEFRSNNRCRPAP